MAKITVAALALLIAISAAETPQAQGAGVLVYAVHEDGFGFYQLAGLALMAPDGSHQVTTPPGFSGFPTWGK